MKSDRIALTLAFATGSPSSSNTLPEMVAWGVSGKVRSFTSSPLLKVRMVPTPMLRFEP